MVLALTIFYAVVLHPIYTLAYTVLVLIYVHVPLPESLVDASLGTIYNLPYHL
jgi:hypothetical protein